MHDEHSHLVHPVITKARSKRPCHILRVLREVTIQETPSRIQVDF